MAGRKVRRVNVMITEELFEKLTVIMSRRPVSCSEANRCEMLRTLVGEEYDRSFSGGSPRPVRPAFRERQTL